MTHIKFSTFGVAWRLNFVVRELGHRNLALVYTTTNLWPLTLVGEENLFT